MLWLLPLAGAAVGAAMNKKNPMQGALLGAGIGATGGLLGGAGLAGAAAAEGAGGAAMANGAFLGEGVASGVGAWDASAAASAAGQGGGLLGGMKTALEYAKPVGQAASAAQQVSGGQRAPMPAAPPMMQNPVGVQSLTQLAQQQSPNLNQMQQAYEARMRRRGLLGNY